MLLSPLSVNYIELLYIMSTKHTGPPEVCGQEFYVKR